MLSSVDVIPIFKYKSSTYAEFSSLGSMFQYFDLEICKKVKILFITSGLCV